MTYIKRANIVTLYTHRFSFQGTIQGLLTSLFFNDQQTLDFRSFQIRRDRLVRKLSFARSRLMAIVLLPYRKTRRHGDSGRNYERSTNTKTGANDEEESVLGTGGTQTRNLGQGEFIIVSLSVIIKDFLTNQIGECKGKRN